MFAWGQGRHFPPAVRCRASRSGTDRIAVSSGMTSTTGRFLPLKFKSSTTTCTAPIYCRHSRTAPASKARMRATSLGQVVPPTRSSTKRNTIVSTLSLEMLLEWGVITISRTGQRNMHSRANVAGCLRFNLRAVTYLQSVSRALPTFSAVRSDRACRNHLTHISLLSRKQLGRY